MNPKKQQIISAAYSLFINKGYNASSIQDILDEAGVSKGTFYNYFTSKTECLIAILESIGAEIRQNRMAAAAGKSAADPEVLAEQLCIRIRLNREKNLFALYESIFYSQDKELKQFAKAAYAVELDWISSRIIDVFGAEAKPYALENAAIVHGSIQQLINVWRLNSAEELPTKELSAFVIRRLEAAVTQQIKSGDTFIRAGKLSADLPEESISLDELVDKLASYANRLQEEDAKQLVSFLIEEMRSDTPRKAVTESVLTSLGNTHSTGSELSILLEQVWKLLPALPQTIKS